MQFLPFVFYIMLCMALTASVCGDSPPTGWLDWTGNFPTKKEVKLVDGAISFGAFVNKNNVSFTSVRTDSRMLVPQPKENR